MALTEEQEENIARKVAMEMDDEVGLSQRTTGWWPIRFAVRFLAALPDYKAQLKDLREQVECSTITRDNMEGRLNIATVKLAAMKQQRDALLEALEDKADIASIALRKAWQLGQTYWQQADSDFESQHKKSEVTQARFQELVDETRSAIASVKGGE